MVLPGEKFTKLALFQCINRSSHLRLFFRHKFMNRNVLSLQNRNMYEDMFPQHSSHEIMELLTKQRSVYAGFDPTASSLHVGNLLILMNLLHWQRAGHKVIVLIGGATARIGDPSGKDKDRITQQATIIREQSSRIQKCIANIFANHEEYFWKKLPSDMSPLIPVKYVNNDEWYKDENVIDFIGRVGRHFRMGTMLLKDSVAKRLEGSGMCFTEFAYQIFQAYDWLYLYDKYHCLFQIGGKDQMGNIVAGHNLISRVKGDDKIYALTLPLITDDGGDKFGKSVPNPIWLDSTLTSPFEFYQFLWRTADSKVEQMLKLFTFLPLEIIDSLMCQHRKNPEARIPHTKLAEELTILVHGEKGLERSQNTTAALYNKDLSVLGKIPSEELPKVFQGVPIVEMKMKPGYTILQFALDIPCFFSQSDATRIMDAGAFYINYNKVLHQNELISPSAHILPNNISLVRVGKKHYWVVKWLS